jgi:hypothetical protein
MIDFLVKTKGLTREQAYVLVSVAVDLNIAQVVDVPPRLRIRDLYILSTVVKSGSMAKAARQLAMSQPAVSEAIANLEFDSIHTDMAAELALASSGMTRPFPCAIFLAYSNWAGLTGLELRAGSRGVPR